MHEKERIVYLNRGDLAPEDSNKVSNSKYNAFDFLPLQLYEQFSAPMNLFFLCIAFLQLWRMISPVHPITTWTPLLIVFLVASTKAASDDYARRKADAEANARPYAVWRRGKLLERCPAERIAIGDLVRVNDDEEVPCDLLLLKTADVVADGCAYVETANLDGETDLKVRRARPETTLLSISDLTALRGRLVCEPPNADLYRLDAKLSILGASREGKRASGDEEGGDSSGGSAVRAPSAMPSSPPLTGRDAGQVGFVTPTQGRAGLPLPLALAHAAATASSLVSGAGMVGGPVGNQADVESSSALGMGLGSGHGADGAVGGSGGLSVRQRAGPGSASAGWTGPLGSNSSSRSPGSGINVDQADALLDSDAGTHASANAVHLSMSKEQLLQHGTVLRRTGHVIGLAIYTGPDTKLNQNKAPPPRKVASIDIEINRYVVAVFTVQALLVLVLGLAGTSWWGNGNPSLWYLGWPHSVTPGDSDVTDVDHPLLDVHLGLAGGPGLGSDMDAANPSGLAAGIGAGKLRGAGGTSTGTDGASIADAWSDAAAGAARLLVSVVADSLQPTPSAQPSLDTDVHGSRQLALGGSSGHSGGHAHAWWAGFVLPLRFLLLSSMMIPISLKVSMDLAKAWHARLIAHDQQLYDEASDTPAGVANTAISEDLGRVGVVLTDKTGTLTENVMRLCVLSVEGRLHGWHPGLAAHTDCTPFSQHGSTGVSAHGLGPGHGDPHHTTDAPMLDLLQALALCNTVTPEHVNAVPLTPQESRELRFRSRTASISMGVGLSPDGAGLVRFVPEADGVAQGRDSNGSGDSWSGGFDIPGAPPSSRTSLGASRTSLGPAGRTRSRCIQYASSSPDEEALVLGAARLGVALLHRRMAGPGGMAGGSPGGHGASLEGRGGISHTSASSTAQRVVLSFGQAPSPEHRDRAGSDPADDDRRVWVHDDWPDATWEILHTLPFDSDRKRMSVIVRRAGTGGRASGADMPRTGHGADSHHSGSSWPGLHGPSMPAPRDDRLYLITKGADDVLLPRLSQQRTPQEEAVLNGTLQQLNACAAHGLRTLVVAARVVPPSEYSVWLSAWDRAQTEVGPARDAAVSEVMDTIETGLHLLGATAIEDKLQEGVPEAIADLRKAGIRFWMLTGDKQATAIQIARAAALIGRDDKGMGVNAPHHHHGDTHLFVFKGRSSEDLQAEVSAAVDSRAGLHPGQETAVVVDGPALRYILADAALSRSFTELCLASTAVIACRCTPAQKAGLVRAARAVGGLVALAIGDGGNDVSMIQAADIGVGISGREGQQAARAADYSLARFYFLRRLLLVHGRYSHYRTALVSQYTFYKSQALALVQLLFNATCGFSGCSLLDSFSLTSYNLLWTAVPSLALLLDQDRSITQVLTDPRYFTESIHWQPDKGLWPTTRHYLSPRTFLSWASRALWQSCVVLMVCTWGLADSGASLGQSLTQPQLSLLVFTSLVIIQLITVISEMRSPTRLNLALVGGASVLYVVLQTARLSPVGEALGSWLEGLGAARATAVEADDPARLAPLPLTPPQGSLLLPGVLCVTLAVTMSVGPYLLHAPCFGRQDEHAHGAAGRKDGKAALSTSSGAGASAQYRPTRPTSADRSGHKSKQGRDSSLPPAVGAKLAAIQTSVADAASLLREQGRVVAGAVQQAASAAAAGDRRGLMSALTAAGHAVKSVGRHAGRSRSRGSSKAGYDDHGHNGADEEHNDHDAAGLLLSTPAGRRVAAAMVAPLVSVQASPDIVRHGRESDADEHGYEGEGGHHHGTGGLATEASPFLVVSSPDNVRASAAAAAQRLSFRDQDRHGHGTGAAGNNQQDGGYFMSPDRSSSHRHRDHPYGRGDDPRPGTGSKAPQHLKPRYV